MTRYFVLYGIGRRQGFGLGLNRLLLFIQKAPVEVISYGCLLESKLQPHGASPR